MKKRRTKNSKKRGVAAANTQTRPNTDGVGTPIKIFVEQNPKALLEASRGTDRDLSPFIIDGYVRKDDQPQRPHESIHENVNLAQRANVKQKQLTKKRIDHRSGLHKLRQIILKLRGFYKDSDEIPREDVVDAINEFCGVDPRTEQKYEHLLIRRSYLTPIGHIHQKVTRVTVTTYSQVDSSPKNHPKEYHSNRGYTSYKFGLFAPKPTAQTTIPPVTPPQRRDEGSINIKNMCVSQRGGESKGKPTHREIEKKERLLSHTHNLRPKSFALKVLKTVKDEPKTRDSEGRWLSDEELRIFRAARGEGS